jgi:hypothetical protein
MKDIIYHNGDEHYVITEFKNHYIARNILTREVVTVHKYNCIKIP